MWKAESWNLRWHATFVRICIVNDIMFGSGSPCVRTKGQGLACLNKEIVVRSHLRAKERVKSHLNNEYGR